MVTITSKQEGQFFSAQSAEDSNLTEIMKYFVAALMVEGYSSKSFVALCTDIANNTKEEYASWDDILDTLYF